MDNWKRMLDEALKENGESWSDVEANTMTDSDMEMMFARGVGGKIGCPFTVWTKNSVYFPTAYASFAAVERVSRNPDGKPTEHII